MGEGDGGEMMSIKEYESTEIVTAAPIKKRNGFGIINIFLSVLIIIASIVAIPCCLKQYEKNQTVNRLRNELEQETNRGSRLRIEYEIRTDYKAIEEYVTKNLMMKKQEPYQIEYILRETDSVSVVVNQDSQNDNILSAIARTFSAITEFFK